ncbi:hypothetical protein G6011_01768 [Alternaria panax]|uniref:N-acetyltransferase domain-containing protein n=1 Tax=Alternaria panax TaxID=48097 RepID=A0AAD4IKK1_9PLEO|nr:hypothetical protein G6011_01768 [Alternaria panax]
MPLQVHRITSPTDFEDLVGIQIAAFANGGGITSLLTPTPITDEYLQNSVGRHIKSWTEEQDVVYLKVIDTDLDGKMIAAAKWRINEQERSEEEARRMYPVPDGQDEGRQGLLDFMAFLSRVRREYMGTKPFYFLHILVTHPDHHRRGAGSMLLEWGTKQADRARLPAFLESSPMGRPLYEKMGFQTKEVVTWDLARYGLEGTDFSTVMLREPI